MRLFATLTNVFKRALFSFSIQYLNEYEYRLTNIVEETSLKHNGCERFSSIVQSLNENLPPRLTYI